MFCIDRVLSCNHPAETIRKLRDTLHEIGILMKVAERFFFLACLAIVLFTSCNKDCISSTGIEGE
jgi:hypothetical protein